MSALYMAVLMAVPTLYVAHFEGKPKNTKYQDLRDLLKNLQVLYRECEVV